MFFKIFLFLIETNFQISFVLFFGGNFFYLIKNFQHILQIFSIATQNFQKWMLSIYLSTENEGVDQFRGSHTATIHQLQHNELQIIKSVNFWKKITGPFFGATLLIKISIKLDFILCNKKKVLAHFAAEAILDKIGIPLLLATSGCNWSPELGGNGWHFNPLAPHLCRPSLFGSGPLENNLI